VCARTDDVGPSPARREGALRIRDVEGVWTDEYNAFRYEMGTGRDRAVS